MASLDQFLAEHPSIKTIRPSSPDFETVKTTYIRLDHQPSVIVRPQTDKDVAALISYCVANDVEFVVRVGGHDSFGRSTIPDGLQIDLRDIAYVHVAKNRKLARIGGGIYVGKLLEQLNCLGLTCATGSISSVGFVGWATLGGYGPLAPSFGLGLDQIVAAKLVDADGELVEADETRLIGIRGAGGNFGIITEATIKVYPNDPIQAGLVIYESSKVGETVKSWFTNYNAIVAEGDIPWNLYVQPSIINAPGLGKAFATGFAWAGAESVESKLWQERITNLHGLVIASTIKPTTQAAFVAELTKVVPHVVIRGLCQSVSIKGPEISSDIIDIYAHHAELQPAGAALVSFHSLHGVPTREYPASIFRNRVPHYMVEIVGLSVDQEMAEPGRKWATDFAADLRKSSSALESSYVPLAPPDDATPEKVYGPDKLRYVLDLKREFDPKGVFRNAIPKLQI